MIVFLYKNLKLLFQYQLQISSSSSSSSSSTTSSSSSSSTNRPLDIVQKERQEDALFDGMGGGS